MQGSAVYPPSEQVRYSSGAEPFWLGSCLLQSPRDRKFELRKTCGDRRCWVGGSDSLPDLISDVGPVHVHVIVECRIQRLRVAPTQNESEGASRRVPFAQIVVGGEKCDCSERKLLESWGWSGYSEDLIRRGCSRERRTRSA